MLDPNLSGIEENDRKEETEADCGDQRFEKELEFVSCLTNPQYLQFLAQHGYFDDKNFQKYLEYLQYWNDLEYRKYLIYPHTLQILNLLQHAKFRDELKKPHCIDFIHEQILLKWNYPHAMRRNVIERMKKLACDNTTGTVAEDSIILTNID